MEARVNNGVAGGPETNRCSSRVKVPTKAPVALWDPVFSHAPATPATLDQLGPVLD